MKAMILAAGRGNRLRPLTDHIPKALATVGHRTLIERRIECLRKGGINDIVINLGWLGPQIQSFLKGGESLGVTVRYSDEGDCPRETGGGILKALPILGKEPFWVSNADVICDFPFMHARLKEPYLGHLILVDTPAYRVTGDFALEGEKILGCSSGPLTYSGIGIFRPELFLGIESEIFSYIPLVRKAAAAGLISGEHYVGQWTDVGTRDRLMSASFDDMWERWTTPCVAT